jgi:hypothetical protein
LLLNGERVHSRRSLTRLNALLEADAMRDRVLASVGGVAVMERRPKH